MGINESKSNIDKIQKLHGNHPRFRSNTSPNTIGLTRKTTFKKSSLASTNTLTTDNSSNKSSNHSISSNNSSNLNINGLNKISSENGLNLRPNKSSEKLNSYPKYLIESLKIRDAKSLSPNNNRRPLPNLPKVTNKIPNDEAKINKTENKNSNTNSNSNSNSNSPAKAKNNSEFINPIALILNQNNANLKPKTNSIYDDYVISKQVLGVGISGKVLVVSHKSTQEKYALKVCFAVFI